MKKKLKKQSNDVRKVICLMPVAVHKIQANIWQKVREGEVVTGMSLRQIGEKVGIESPQQIKHHLETMRKMGVIDWQTGQYYFTKFPN